MEKIFVFNGEVESFVLFSKEHIITLLLLVFMYVSMFLSRNKFREQRVDKITRYIMAGVLIFQEILLSLWSLADGSWSLAISLPLHLCGLMVITCSVMLINKSYKIYEIAYLLGIGGATQAILTPDLGSYGFPHYRFYQFFISHGLIILAVLYMTFVHKYKPVFRSLFKAFIGLNAAVPVIGVINYITGGNYFFIARKPEAASIMDYLGDWPWYILSLEAVAIILLLIAYLPFAIENYINKRREKKKIKVYAD